MYDRNKFKEDTSGEKKYILQRLHTVQGKELIQNHTERFSI